MSLQRRDFIALLGGAAAAWPLAANAQQGERMRRIGVLAHFSEGDPTAVRLFSAFEHKLSDLGWTKGHNVGIDYRWTAARPDQVRQFAAELTAKQPDVLLGSSGPMVEALLQATRTIPIVFTSVLDPVGSGIIESLARPGGNATGFELIEWSISEKWIDLLKQIAPRTTRAGVVRDPSVPGGSGQFGALQAPARSLGVELRPIDSRGTDSIERGIAAFAQQPNGGLIHTVSESGTVYRQTVIRLAARYKLPAIYPLRYYAQEGGLMSYGPDQTELYRLAAGYVDRVLKGEKPGDLPVQAPTKYELLINLKTAKALALAVPPTLLVAADEVIE
jgi:putative ABC transport system substrate-binding protein